MVKSLLRYLTNFGKSNLICLYLVKSKCRNHGDKKFSRGKESTTKGYRRYNNLGKRLYD